MKNENFYEGKFIKTERWRGGKMLFLPFLHKLARQRLFVRHLKKGKRDKIILDIGCGGGNDLFTRFGEVWGVDISKSSLKFAKTIYFKTILSSADNIPIKEKGVDIVLSADLLGHLPPKLKNKVLRETFRVLKPGGKAFHYSEIKGNDLFCRWAKKYPSLYKKYFIDQDGHLGLESIEDLTKRFDQAGYKVVRAIPLFKLPFDLTEFCKRFDNEFKQKNLFISALVGTARACNKVKPLKLIMSFLVVFWPILFLFFASFSCGRGIFNSAKTARQAVAVFKRIIGQRTLFCPQKSL